MSVSPIIIVHERLARWHRQLRPRFMAWDDGVRWGESRSGADLAGWVRGEVCPLVLLDLGNDVAGGFAALAGVMTRAPGALVLVMDADRRAGVAEVAREGGAAQVMSGRVGADAVFDLLVRWVSIARRRTEAAGWARPIEQEPEPWEDPDEFAKRWLARARWAGR